MAAALLEVFERLDSDLDGVLCRDELNGFLEVAWPRNLKKQQQRSFAAMLLYLVEC